MARYVVLYFKDNEHAERFVAEARDFNGQLTNICLDKVQLDGRVDALIPAPTQFCEDNHSRKMPAWTLGKKFGWWVCRDCRRPSKGWGTSFRAVINSGRNLIDDIRIGGSGIQGWDQTQFLDVDNSPKVTRQDP